MPKNINSTLTYYTSYYDNNSCSLVSMSPPSSDHEFPFGGNIFDKHGVHRDPEKIKVILRSPAPPIVHEVQPSFGLCGFSHQLLEGFQAVAAPRTAMFKADFKWEGTTVQKAALEKLKQAMRSATHLIATVPKQLYHLYTDASKDCFGATLA